ncbi:MAG TPA: hypothetical protein PKB09_00625 [Candidatus Saccharibacteria bacterium]|nr:hypothetical protein [Candidatus Saccharibacteria bacterium]
MTNFENLGKFEITQDDGAVWTAFYDRQQPDDKYLLMTSSGRGLFLGEKGTQFHDLKELFSDYRDAETEGEEFDGRRNFLGKGQQATVYGMGWLAVREIPGKQGLYRTVSELQSMDELACVVEGGLPRWINVPHMFACYSDPELQKRYMLMQRIDSGLTIEDVVNYPNVDEHAAKRTLAELGREPNDNDKSELIRLFSTARFVIGKVIEERGRAPESMLVDWEHRNVIVEALRTPIAGERFSLSIIDQYK